MNKKIQFFLSMLLTIGAFIVPTAVFAVVQTLNGQTGQTQTFSDDTNIIITSASNIHSLGWQGLLPLSRGGTGASSFTAGSLLFSNGTSITQNNPNLFWDNINNRLGIGTTSPNSKLDVGGNVSISGNLNVAGNIINSSFVPYTGAIANVNLGSNTITAGNISGTNTGDQNLSGLVPYTGATGDIDLGVHGVITPSVTTINNSIPMDLSIGAGTALGGSTTVGKININSGWGSGTEAGGGINLKTGNGGPTGHGGYLTISTGSGGSSSGSGGNIVFTAGSAQAGNGDGGSMLFNLGVGSGTGQDGRIIINNGILDLGSNKLAWVNGNLTTSGTGNYVFSADNNSLGGHLNFNGLTTSDKTFTFPDASGTLGLLETNQTWSGLNKFEASTNSTIYVGSSVKSGCIAMGDSDGSGVTYITANDGVLSASATKPDICQ